MFCVICFVPNHNLIFVTFRKIGRFYVRRTVGLKFQLKAIHNQMQEYQTGAQKTTLPDKFKYTSGPDVKAQGKKSGVEEKIQEDRDHVRHLVK